MKSDYGGKTRLQPSKDQFQTLLGWVGSQRFTYNYLLDQKQTIYQIFKENVTYNDQSAWLKNLKGYKLWLKDVPSQTLQQTVMHLDHSFHRFFNGQGEYPQFKKIFRNEAKLHFPQDFTVKRLNRKWGQLTLPKMKEPIRFYWTTAMPKKPSRIRSIAISLKNERFYLSFNSQKYTLKVAPKNSSIGEDVGCNITVATSKEIDGKQLHNLDTPKLKKKEDRIAELQRRQSTKELKSSRWCKLQKQINKIYENTSNYRQDWHHKLTRKIAKNHSLTFRENLDIKSMTKSNSGTIENPGTDVARKSGLNKSILRQGWGIHFRQLAYKSIWYGTGSFKNPPFYSSQKCFYCKHVSESNRDTGSTLFKCVLCGYKEHADINSADNQQEDGLASYIAGDEWTIITHPLQNPIAKKGRWTKRRRKSQSNVKSPAKEQGVDSSKLSIES